jgi:uridine kinase
LCAQKIIERAAQKTPFLVAITGDSGSGKSFYSELIRKQLDLLGTDYQYVDHDSFLISRKDREPINNEYYSDGEFAGKSKWEILENMFRLDVYSKVIQDLKESKAVTYLPYRREKGAVDTMPITIQPSSIVIFDTSMMLEHMDMVIEVDADMEKIIERKKQRDSDVRTPEQIEDMHRRVQGFYWQRKKPHNADIKIDNNDFQNPKIVIK